MAEDPRGRNRPGGRRPRRRHDRRRRSCRQGESTGRVRRGGADARGGFAVGGDGSIHVAGAIQASERKVIVDALLVKFASDGSLAWDRVWGGRSGDVSSGVAIAADGTVLWSGDSNSYGVGSDDAFLVRRWRASLHSPTGPGIVAQ